jgi:hypothetical protein
VDSPAWRHIQMLASLVSEDGNTPRIDGFFDNIEPLTEWQPARFSPTSHVEAQLPLHAEHELP